MRTGVGVSVGVGVEVEVGEGEFVVGTVGMLMVFVGNLSVDSTIGGIAVAASVGAGSDSTFSGEAHPIKTKVKIAQLKTLPGKFTGRSSQQLVIRTLPGRRRASKILDFNAC